jgi:hypothetical protein
MRKGSAIDNKERGPLPVLDNLRHQIATRASQILTKPKLARLKRDGGYHKL